MSILARFGRFVGKGAPNLTAVGNPGNPEQPEKSEKLDNLWAILYHNKYRGVEQSGSSSGS